MAGIDRERETATTKANKSPLAFTLLANIFNTPNGTRESYKKRKAILNRSSRSMPSTYAAYATYAIYAICAPRIAFPVSEKGQDSNRKKFNPDDNCVIAPRRNGQPYAFRFVYFCIG